MIKLAIGKLPPWDCGHILLSPIPNPVAHLEGDAADAIRVFGKGMVSEIYVVAGLELSDDPGEEGSPFVFMPDEWWFLMTPDGRIVFESKPEIQLKSGKSKFNLAPIEGTNLWELTRVG